MIDWIIYAVLGILCLTTLYLIRKVNQPLVIRRTRTTEEGIPELGDIGDILKEMQPEIIKNLKLNDEQQKTLKKWITTIDVITKSKITRWILKKVSNL